jgi:NAD(P)-dependent dehydrogenase (short-subunit alcohol dehydrogenase family)
MADSPARAGTGSPSPVVAVVASGGPLVDAVERRLAQHGWRTVVGHVQAPTEEELDGLVVDLGLLGPATGTRLDVGTFIDLVETARPRLRAKEGGGAGIVAVGSRDALGWPTRPRAAAAAGALVSAVRSLAMELGPAGVAVNLVLSLPPEPEAEPRGDGARRSTHLREPSPLLPHDSTADDVASAVAFFLGDQSRYITGQVLSCCGGATLLSNLSA